MWFSGEICIKLLHITLPYLQQLGVNDGIGSTDLNQPTIGDCASSVAVSLKTELFCVQ